MDFVIESTLAPIMGESISTNSEDEVRFNCPRCKYKGKSDDDKHHMYLNTVKEKFICHRCGWKGPLERLYKYLGISSKRKMSVAGWDDKIQRLLNPSFFEDATSETEYVAPIELPEDYTPCMVGTDAASYVIRRGFTENMMKDRRVGFGVGKLKGMIIFPEFKDGKLLYWTAKPYVHWRKAPKNCSREKAGYVYWLENVPHNDYCVITEAIFDAVVYGDRGVALLGAAATKEQVENLLSKKFQRYYLSLDGDCRNTKQIALGRLLWQQGADVRLINLPTTEDPSSLGRPMSLSYLQKSLKYHPDNLWAVELEASL